jgi:hypothetical protein
LEDKEFHDLVVKTALENCEFYNHINSRERYLKALAESCKLGRVSIRQHKQANETMMHDEKTN